jgi:uncharacterized membrane protein
MKERFCKAYFGRSTVILLLLLFARMVAAQEDYRVLQLEISIYRDGVAHVSYAISVNSTAPSISLALLGTAANILATDEKGQIVRYDVTSKEISIYTMGATKVLLEYDTFAITSKEGPVWTVKLNLVFQGKVILPNDASIVYLNEKPLLIEAQDGRPALTLGKGAWEISYVIPMRTTASTTQSLSTLPQLAWPLLPAIVIATAVSVAVLLNLGVLRRRRPLPDQISQADGEVLELIRSRGGRMFESELRQLLGIPKTSAWRRVKKLEKLGLVRTRKVGTQNEVELV